MKTYRLTFSLPLIDNSPLMDVTVKAEDEDAALDAGFDEAFRQYPQFGGFQIEDISEETE